MPILTSPNNNKSKVLITGTNGYIGSWVVKTALDRGYTVRAVVRSEARASELRKLFSEFEAGGRLEYVVVPDMMKEGAFDEAVDGVDGVIHTASPLMGNGHTNEDYIRPAVDGTLGILKSALKKGPSIKRIVITSSVVSVFSTRTDHKVAVTYTEADWNEDDVAWVNDPAKPFEYVVAYSASKMLAEKAAWEFYDAHKKEAGWDVTFILPAMVYGPPVQSLASPADLPSTQKIWWDGVMGKDATVGSREHLSQGANWVNVQDVAEAHVRSLEKEEAGGERILLSNGKYVWQEWLDIVKSLLPSVAPGSTYALAEGFKDIENKVPFYFDPSKEKRILGIRHKTKEETARDILEHAARQGWL